jgi:ribonuclease-3
MVGKYIEPNREDLERIQESLGHEFRESDLLIQALTRKAYATEKGHEGLHHEHQDAFRVLGDALLGAIIVEKLRSEGLKTGKDITVAKHQWENGTILGEIAYGLCVSKCIYMNSGEKKEEAHKQPRVLAETLEALIGAIFLDRKRCIEETEEVVLLWFPEKLTG